MRNSYELHISSYEVNNKFVCSSNKFNVKLWIYGFIWTSYEWAPGSIVKCSWEEIQINGALMERYGLWCRNCIFIDSRIACILHSNKEIWFGTPSVRHNISVLQCCFLGRFYISTILSVTFLVCFLKTWSAFLCWIDYLINRMRYWIVEILPLPAFANRAELH